MAVQRRATAVDLTTVTALAAVALFEITVTVGPYSVHDHLPIAVAAGLALCGALFWRRRQPLTVAVFALATMFAAFRLGVVPQAWLVPYVLVLAYSAGAHARGWESVAGLVTTLLIGEVIAVHSAEGSAAPSASDYVFTATVCGVGWLAGYALRRRHEQATADLRAERARIARELHDVVAHGLGVIAVQSDAAEQALAHDPELVAEPLRAIRATARDSLAEMRRLVGVLRVDDEAGPAPPQPGIRQLCTLIEEVRATGAPVTLDLVPPPAPLPPGLDLAVYRIIQEALTNARRHAGPSAAVHIRAEADDRNISIEVTDDGGSTRSSPENGGHGLLGMRERVALYGGRFDAAALAGGGFRVRADLPIPPERP